MPLTFLHWQWLLTTSATQDAQGDTEGSIFMLGEEFVFLLLGAECVGRGQSRQTLGLHCRCLGFLSGGSPGETGLLRLS